MIGKRNNSILGLSVTEQQIVIAEWSGGDPVRTVTVKLSAELSLDRDASAVGAAVAAKLREQHVRAKRAVVGLPTRWLMTADREVPPSDITAGQSALRLQAERLSSVESDAMTFDYVGSIRSSETSRVLLVGTPQRRIEQVQKLALAAGLHVIAVTSTALALAERTLSKYSNAGSVTVLGNDGAAMVGLVQGKIRALRHLSAGPAGLDAATNVSLASELRKALTLLPGGSVGSSGAVIWDAVGIAPTLRTQLTQTLQSEIQWGDWSAVLSPSAASQELPPEAIPALVLAACAGARQLPVNWLDSRLKVIPARRWGRRSAWAAALAGAAALGFASLYADVRSLETQSVELSARLNSMADEIKTADATVQRVTFGSGYFESRPAMLEMLREVALAFGYDSSVWTTSLTAKESGQLQISGRATDQRAVLALLDRMKKSQKLKDVKLLDTREAGGSSKDVSFSISLQFVATE